LTLAKNIFWTFRLLLLPSSAKIKMQMSNGVLLGLCIQYVIKLNHASKKLYYNTCKPVLIAFLHYDLLLRKLIQFRVVS